MRSPTVTPRILLLAPLEEERRLLAASFGQVWPIEDVEGLRVPCSFVRPWATLLAPGGHGKTQFATQTQYLLSQFPGVDLVICAGAAGSLDSTVAVGDIVVGSETVEHDFRNRFVPRPPPRFKGHPPTIERLRRSAHGLTGFSVRFDVIASGDEDVVTSERAAEVRAETDAICVAWEGSGAARAAGFNGLGMVEVRAITDLADKEAAQRFEENLPIAMHNLATLLARFLGDQ